MNDEKNEHTKSGTLSIVIPVFNEEKNIQAIYSRLSELVNKRLKDFVCELIFIDDGSRDATWANISSLNQNEGVLRVKGVKLTRNFGKDAAMEAGLKIATGVAVVTMDGDLQHPPELILNFVEEWRNGNDIVRARNENPPHRNIFKKMCSMFFYRLMNILSSYKIAPGASDFCLMDRKVVDKLNEMTEKGKFYRALTAWTGFKSITIPYKAADRARGKSVYTFAKLFSLGRTAIVSSSTLPMTVIIIFGCLLVFMGGIITIGLLVYKYFIDWEYIGGAVVLAAFVIFNNGLLMIAMGIMSLYQLAVYEEVKNRPSYIIGEVI